MAGVDGKAARALVGPLGRTHDPAPLLRAALGRNQFAQWAEPAARRLTAAVEGLGPPVHVSTDYVDENARVTPWEMFGETDARSALAQAESAVADAQELVRG